MNILHNLVRDGVCLSILLIVADNAAILLAGASAVIASVLLSKKHTKAVNGRQVKVAGIGSYLKGTHTKRSNKIWQFLLNKEMVTDIDTTINKYLTENRPFLQQKYSLRALAKDVNIPLHYLSAFINHHYKMHFNDFINSHRVSHCKEMIMKGECEYKTLEAVSFESGFSNRNTFTSAFKKETGQRPSEFLKRLKKN